MPTQPLRATSLTCACLMLCFTLAAVPSTTANVMPEALALVHIVPNTYTGSGLGPAPVIETCEDVQQYTQELGRIECGVVIFPAAYVGQNLLIHSVEATVQWPESWQYLGWERCSGAMGFLHREGSQAEIDLSWSPPRGFPSEAFLVARLLFEVPDRGEFAFLPGSTLVELGDGVATFLVYPWEVPGRAGVECGDCTMPCQSAAYCLPTIEPERLAVLLAPGSSTQSHFTVEAVHAVGPPESCDPSFEASDPWMTVTSTQIDWMTWELTVTVSAAGLGSGDHRGWIRATTWCTACAEVDLTVTGTAGVEEGPTEPASWGQIKHGFR